MKRRNYKHYIRKSHRFLGIFIGIQFIFWTLGGLYFSWTNIVQIRGDHLRADLEQGLNFQQLIVSPQPAAGRLITTGQAASISGVKIIELFGRPHYEIAYKTPTGEDALVIVDASNGEIRPAITAAEAERIATEALAAKLPLKDIVYLTAENVGGHHEYREKPLPAWAVSFEGDESLTVYLSAQTGQVGAFRTGDWRIFDFLWMLHTMDFKERDNINNYLLRGFSLLGIITILSGFLLFFVSSKFWRRILFRSSPNNN